MNKQALFAYTAKVFGALFAPFGKKKQATALSYIVEALVPIWRQALPGSDRCLSFYGPSYKAIYRGWTLFTKEPDTIAWIDGFAPDSVLWDVGACVGVYSLYAAAKGHSAVAFEPAAVNYFVLNQNIDLNGMHDKVRAYCLALSDSTKADTLNFRTVRIGASHHQFGVTENVNGVPFEPGFRQGTIGYSIDELLEKFDLPFPDYIKIDVDGIEAKVIAGAERTLADPRLKSVLVEVQETRTDAKDVFSRLEAAGFKGRKSRRLNYIFERS